jgi:eukaryotic-like serine/threonine-protein kinase
MSDAPARSRNLKAQVRVGRGQATTDEELRSYLQVRLALFAKAVFWSFVALLVFLFAMYARYPDIKPVHQDLIYATGTIALALLAFLWRLLVRGKRSVELLHAIDLVITIGSGVTFGIVAPLAYNLQAAAYTCLLYESFTIFTRALIVPSTANRTLVSSSLAFVPIIVGAIVLAVITDGTEHQLEIPGVAFVAGCVLYNSVAVLLATTGSRIIYDLRHKVSQVQQLGQYTLGRKIGAGGMGEVYHAEHALLRRQTAIKLISPGRETTDLDRFESEVQSMSQLTHANTVSVFDYGRSYDGRLYYAMEFLPGIDLGRLVSGHGALPANRVVRILVQVAGALQEAHDSGFIHRDIKPGNIILCERGGVPDVAKVLDFGLVKTISDPDTTAQLMGTPGYIAPETIIDPTRRPTPAVDIYALGAIGYFLLTGKHVFGGRSREILMMHKDKPPPPFSEAAPAREIPAALEAIIMKCLAKDPSDRYASTTELAAALDGLDPISDWDRPRALAWWAEQRAKVAATPSTDAKTVTLNIDLEQRDGDDKT